VHEGAVIVSKQVLSRLLHIYRFKYMEGNVSTENHCKLPSTVVIWHSSIGIFKFHLFRLPHNKIVMSNKIQRNLKYWSCLRNFRTFKQILQAGWKRRLHSFIYLLIFMHLILSFMNFLRDEINLNDIGVYLICVTRSLRYNKIV
jgi:hypothetical protein